MVWIDNLLLNYLWKCKGGRKAKTISEKINVRWQYYLTSNLPSGYSNGERLCTMAGRQINGMKPALDRKIPFSETNEEPSILLKTNWASQTSQEQRLFQSTGQEHFNIHVGKKSHSPPSQNKSTDLYVGTNMRMLLGENSRSFMGQNFLRLKKRLNKNVINWASSNLKTFRLKLIIKTMKRCATYWRKYM